MTWRQQSNFWEIVERKLRGFKIYLLDENSTTQKMKFSIKDFFSKCDQILSFLRIWSHLLKKSLMENLIFAQWSPILSIFNITDFCKETG